MKALISEKEKAIALRKQGKSYNEIIALVPVAKSSHSPNKKKTIYAEMYQNA
jgi:hypothetical protein